MLHSPLGRAPAPTETPWTLEALGEPAIALAVFGTPAPQGSKTAFAVTRGRGANKTYTGKVSLVESSADVTPWRNAVQAVAVYFKQRHRLQTAGPWVPLDGPLVADMVFTLPKGVTHAKWLDWHDKKPDLDKLARSTGDALSDAGVWTDDARVAGYRRLDKRWVGSSDPDALHAPGAVIRVWQVPADLIEARKVESRRNR